MRDYGHEVTADEVGLRKFGDTIQVAGAVYRGEGQLFLLFFPGEVADSREPQTHLIVRDWEAFLRQTDTLEMEVSFQGPDGAVRKAMVRKSERQIEASITWNVFRRDHYRCRYCGNNQTPLTVDHVRTWESGGPSIEANLVTSCKRCNRERGKLPYAEWLASEYYTKRKHSRLLVDHEANVALLGKLDSIPMRTFPRSR